MRKILIVTGGMAPAIVTETIWALWRQHRPAFWPDKVRVVVTADARDRYETLLLGDHGKLALLSEELKRPSLHKVTKIDWTPCPDIRSDADAIAFGDKVCEVVQDETADAEAMVHLSLAGGRKTMSFHGGAAMTLFGRPQDELSHVLVRPADLERQDADFWWPGHNKPGEVELALIPFVRVRGRLPAAMLKQRIDYARYVVLVNAAIAGTTPVVELIRDTSILRIAGGAATLKLEPQGFAVYYLLAEWAKAVVPGAGPNGIGGNNVGWLTATTIRRPDLARRNPVERLARIGGGKLGARLAPTPANKTQEEENYKVLRDGVSYLRERIAAAIGDQALVSRLISEPVGGRSETNPARFGLRLSPDEIVLRAHEGGPEIAPFAHIFPSD